MAVIRRFYVETFSLLWCTDSGSGALFAYNWCILESLRLTPHSFQRLQTSINKLSRRLTVLYQSHYDALSIICHRFKSDQSGIRVNESPVTKGITRRCMKYTCD